MGGHALTLLHHFDPGVQGKLLSSCRRGPSSHGVIVTCPRCDGCRLKPALSRQSARPPFLRHRVRSACHLCHQHRRPDTDRCREAPDKGQCAAQHPLRQQAVATSPASPCPRPSAPTSYTVRAVMTWLHSTFRQLLVCSCHITWPILLRLSLLRAQTATYQALRGPLKDTRLARHAAAYAADIGCAKVPAPVMQGG